MFLLMLQQMKCLFDGQCKIDVNTRRFCPFCRLKQCFAAGMKKDLILGIASLPLSHLCITVMVHVLSVECIIGISYLSLTYITVFLSRLMCYVK